MSKIGYTLNNLEDTKEILVKHYQQSTDPHTKDTIEENIKRINELITFLHQVNDW